MPQGYHLTLLEKERVEKLVRDGLTIAIICERTGLKRSCVQKIYNAVKR